MPPSGSFLRMIDLKAMRVNADLTQGDLAEILGVERSYISRLERREREPDLDMVERWAKACGWAVVLMGPEKGAHLGHLDAMPAEERAAFLALAEKWSELEETRRADLMHLVKLWLEPSK